MLEEIGADEEDLEVLEEEREELATAIRENRIGELDEEIKRVKQAILAKRQKLGDFNAGI